METSASGMLIYFLNGKYEHSQLTIDFAIREITEDMPEGISSVISRITKSTDNLGEWKHRLPECSYTFLNGSIQAFPTSPLTFAMREITEDMPMKAYPRLFASVLQKSTDYLWRMETSASGMLIYFPEWKVYEHSRSLTVDFAIREITEDMPMKGISSVISRITSQQISWRMETSASGMLIYFPEWKVCGIQASPLTLQYVK